MWRLSSSAPATKNLLPQLQWKACKCVFNMLVKCETSQQKNVTTHTHCRIRWASGVIGITLLKRKQILATRFLLESLSRIVNAVKTAYWSSCLQNERFKIHTFLKQSSSVFCKGHEIPLIFKSRLAPEPAIIKNWGELRNKDKLHRRK